MNSTLKSLVFWVVLVVVGVLIVLLRPGAARRAGDQLTASEGLTDESRSRDRSYP